MTATYTNGEPMAKIPSRDHYFDKAKKENYLARSVYKLKELDQKAKLLRPGMRVLDLGASPGSWSQYAAERVGPKGSVTAVDLKEPGRPIEGVEWILGDVFELDLVKLTGDKPFDLVMSDMAPKTTGQAKVDAARSVGLAEAALALAEEVLAPKGQVVVKVFMGADFQELVRQVRQKFKRSRVLKPKASLKQSKETYILAAEPKR